MGLSREQRLTKGSVRVEELPLTPQEFFVLSRVDGTPTVGEIVLGSGLAAPEAERIVSRLVELGALEVRGDPETGMPSAPEASGASASKTPPGLRDRAHARRRELLRSQLTAREGAPDSANPPAGGDAPRQSTQDEDAARFERFSIEPVSPDDARLEQDLAVPIDDQRWILAMSDGLDTLTPFEILGMTPSHDMKAIRRAYHDASRKLHPDTYYGRNLGAYRELLSTLFHRAKMAYAELRDASVRTPLVDAHIEAKVRARKAREQQEAAAKAADDERRELEEAEARARRRARSVERLRAERDRVKTKLGAEAKRHREEAREAEEAGNLAKAANLYRVALNATPEDRELEARWRACLTRARQVRAADAFSKARRHVEVGQSKEAVKLFVEAAEADPTAEHLAHAADAIRDTDPANARQYALAALQALGPPPSSSEGGTTMAAQRGALHAMIARAFLGAGQRQSAREQALLAQRLRPGDPEVRTLLNSIKVT